MVVSAVEQTGEVPSFVDRLGERVVVPQPSGALFEVLHFRHELSSAPFFESAVKARLKRLSNFRHPSYARATRVQREASHEHRLALVSGYTSGRRLADIILLARRGKIRPKTSAVLSLTRQLMTAVALLHDYAPDVFHGTIGPERLVIAPDGRLVITEYVLGEALERAVAEWGPTSVWREYRVPMLGDTSLARYGRRVDLVQIGLVALALLVGRPLTDTEYPGGLSGALNLAMEIGADGQEAPLGAGLRDWLTRLLLADSESAFRTLLEAQKAFGRMVEEDDRYGVSSVAVESFLAQCEESALLPGGALEREWERPSPAEEQPSAAESGGAHAVGSEPEALPAASAEPSAGEPQAGEPEVRPSPAAGTTPRAGDEESDPFWPVVVGSDTIGTLFDTFKPTGPVRESHIVSIPEAGAPEKLSARDQLAGATSTPAEQREDRATGSGGASGRTTGEIEFPDQTPADGTPAAGSGWLEDDDRASAARQLRETLFEAPPPPTPPAPVRPGLDEEPAIAEPATVATHAWTPSFAPPPDAKLDVVVVDQPPPMAPPSPAAPAARVAAQAEQPSSSRRVPAVLSYEDIHNSAQPRRALPVALIAALVVIVVAAGVGFAVWSSRSSNGRPADAAAAGSNRTTAGGEPGGAKITTQPPGGKITIDGSVRGTAPLQVDGLSAGSHLLTAESDWGSVDQEFRVEPGKTVPIAVTIAGWVRFVAPVELVVSENGRNYGTTGKGQLMVPSGRHHFELANQAVAVRITQFVDVPGGQVKVVSVELPQGTINLSADQPAEVLLDGQVIGRTPMMSVATPLGQHEVVFRSEKYGEVSYTVNVTLAAPVRLTVNFLKR